MLYNYLQKRRFKKWLDQIEKWTYCYRCGDEMEMGVFFPPTTTYYSPTTGEPQNAMLAWGCHQYRKGNAKKEGTHNFHFLKVDMTPMLHAYLVEHKPMGWEAIVNVFEKESQPEV